MALTEPQAGSSLTDVKTTRDADRARALPDPRKQGLHLRRRPGPHREHRPPDARADRRRAPRHQGRLALRGPEEAPRERQARRQRRALRGRVPQDGLARHPQHRAQPRRERRLPRLAGGRAAPGHLVHVPDDERGAPDGRDAGHRHGFGRVLRVAGVRADAAAGAAARPRRTRRARRSRSSSTPTCGGCSCARRPSSRARSRSASRPRATPTSPPTAPTPEERRRALLAPRHDDADRQVVLGREGLRVERARRADPRRLRLHERIPARGVASRSEAQQHPRGDDVHAQHGSARPQGGRRRGRRAAPPGRGDRRRDRGARPRRASIPNGAPRSSARVGARGRGHDAARVPRAWAVRSTR